MAYLSVCFIILLVIYNVKATTDNEYCIISDLRMCNTTADLPCCSQLKDSTWMMEIGVHASQQIMRGSYVPNTNCQDRKCAKSTRAFMKSLGVLKHDIAKLMESEYSLKVTIAAELLLSYVDGNICDLVSTITNSQSVLDGQLTCEQIISHFSLEYSLYNTFIALHNLHPNDELTDDWKALWAEKTLCAEIAIADKLSEKYNLIDHNYMMPC